MLIALQLSAFPLLSNASDKWELVKDRKGIKVYTRPFEGSTVDEFKGTAVINAGIESVLALFMDIDKQPEWMDQCVDARLVKKVNDFEGIIYNVAELPWPCDDRDVVVRQYFKVDDNGQVIIDFHALENADTLVPKREETVRMTDLKGQWVLVSMDRKRIWATYKIRLDPEGMIPTWMANYASRNIPYETLRSVIERVKDKKYLDLGKKLRIQYGAIANEIVRGRLRANANEIGDPALLKRLQDDQQLIDIILISDSEVRPLILQWIAEHYEHKNGEWMKKNPESGT